MNTRLRTLAIGAVGIGAVGLLALGAGTAMAATNGPNAPWSVGTDRGPGWGPMDPDDCPMFNGGAGGGYGARGGNTAAADYLGLTTTQLLDQMRSGKSLADIATAQGKSVSGLEDAMLAQVKKNLDANTRLTDQQKADALARAKDRIHYMVTTAHTPGSGYGSGGGMMGGGYGGGMMGGRGGMWG